jgi:predicted aspartyl protease
MYVNLQVRGQGIKALVDTGSTVSTASEAVIKNLKIPLAETAPLTITYRNKSRQVTSKAAHIKYEVDDRQGSCNLMLVDDQNEDIILGMDCLVSTQALVDPVNRLLIWPEGQNEATVLSEDKLLYVNQLLTQFPKILHKDGDPLALLRSTIAMP